uniref:Late embryogenesis abundant protein LEA-2 subgroup domain-containing protein n=1 Tax=Oryza nivara TaxID=4536 RepID=A0A0E0HK43_ORYNI
MGKEEDEGKSSSSSCNWHRQRHVIVLASLGGVLAATVVVITMSVVLQPPHIGFAVERATVVRSNDDNHDPVRLELTVKIAKNTTTGGNVGAKVMYKSVLISLEAISTTDAEIFDLEIPKKAPSPTYLKGTADLIINAELKLVGYSKQSSLANNSVNGVPVTVIIRALVSFEIGLVNTGSYEITFRRSDVVFNETKLS